MPVATFGFLVLPSVQLNWGCVGNSLVGLTGLQNCRDPVVKNIPQRSFSAENLQPLPEKILHVLANSMYRIYNAKGGTDCTLQFCAFCRIFRNVWAPYNWIGFTVLRIFSLFGCNNYQQGARNDKNGMDNEAISKEEKLINRNELVNFRCWLDSIQK